MLNSNNISIRILESPDSIRKSNSMPIEVKGLQNMEYCILNIAKKDIVVIYNILFTIKTSPNIVNMIIDCIPSKEYIYAKLVINSKFIGIIICNKNFNLIEEKVELKYEEIDNLLENFYQIITDFL